MRGHPEARRFYVRYVHQWCSIRPHVSRPRLAEVGVPPGDLVPALDLGEQDAGPGPVPARPDRGSPGDAMILPAIRESDLPAEPEPQAPPPSPRPPVPAAPPWRRMLRGGGRWGLAAGALLALGLVAVLFAPRGGPAAPVAILASVTDARWGEVRRAPLPGEALPPGRLRLSEGSARLKFAGGAEVLLQGPARFELLGASEVRLTQGRLTAEVPRAAAGFTVRTPAADVIDLSTRFGVLVESGGATEAHVLQGRVRLEPAAGGRAGTELTASQASRVEAGGQSVAAVALRPGDFGERPPAPADVPAAKPVVIDLVDVVAGGDGKQGRRGRGVDPSTGRTYDREPTAAELYGAPGEPGAFRPVLGQPLIAGVFVPDGGAGPVVLDPAGHRFDGFPDTAGTSYYWLWAGGPVRVTAAVPIPTVGTAIGPIDFGAPGRGLLFMHANKGITFDLRALRNAHPGRPFSRFRTTVDDTADDYMKRTNIPAANPGVNAGNPREGEGGAKGGVAGGGHRSDFWVFVDGELRFSRSPMKSPEPGPAVTVELGPDDRFLTLVVTDGGDGHVLDWIIVGEPRLE